METIEKGYLLRLPYLLLFLTNILYSSELIELERINIEAFSFVGNHSISDEILSKSLSSYLNKDLTLDEIEKIRLDVSKLYINSGYINSGAIIKNQNFDGTLNIEIIEGRVKQIDVNSEFLDRDFIINRLKLDGTFNINSLKNSLYSLRESEPIESIKASIEPIAEGEAKLNLDVKEKNRWILHTYLNNYQSENSGENKIGVFIKNRNLTGVGDSFAFDYGFTKGKDEFLISYSRYLGDRARVSISTQKSNLKVITREFKDLDIESEAIKHQILINYPIFDSYQKKLDFSLGAGYEEVKSSLLDEPFSIVKGSKDGIYKTSNIDLSISYLNRSSEYLLYLNSKFDLGVRLFGALDNQEIDSEYLTYLFESLYIKRLDDKKNLKFKSNIFLSDDKLLPSKKLSIGGVNSVRGYGESLYSTSKAITLSGELELKVGENLSIVPFIDFAKGSDESGSFESLASGGVGFEYRGSVLDWELYFAKPINQTYKSDSIQSKGIHFQVKLKVFE